MNNPQEITLFLDNSGKNENCGIKKGAVSCAKKIERGTSIGIIGCWFLHR
ncbi:hypothetical protein HMPREF0454_03143 [Hafnia alvei ATCC 51873]|uniref:Uncharacterized protein n=1 Tax=Hafnia alvei ATCC 51873 TaxID=1002364 RepID=G9Y9H5_HAFAL|nr:hypothetical protein HMPREF0454_03143 [Hafnia alvei ATCC 51873]